MKEKLSNFAKVWKWTKLEEIVNKISNGITQRQFKDGKGVPVTRIETISNGTINLTRLGYLNNLTQEVIEKYKLLKGDILFSHINSDLHLGKTAIFNFSNFILLHGMNLLLIRVNTLIIMPEFLNYLFNYYRFSGFFISIAQHAVNQSSINQGKLKNLPVPLPPLNEQNRIVEKIEELFSDLDKATEDLKKTQVQLKIYRQAVFKAAFEGKLTEEWRQTRKEASNIEHITLNGICIKAEKIKNEENSERKIKYLDIGSIDNKVFKIVSHKTYQIKDAPSRAKQIVKEGDTLFSTVRTYLKNIAYVHSEYNNEICSTGFCVIRPKKDVLASKYIFYYIISDDFVNRVSPLQTGTSYPAVRDEDILKQEISLVTIDEQEQIVQEIESRLSVCDKLEETIEQSVKKIEYLRQSILKKAFEGKLVPQDPNDLPACELLKQIKIKKDKMSKNGK